MGKNMIYLGSNKIKVWIIIIGLIVSMWLLQACEKKDGSNESKYNYYDLLHDIGRIKENGGYECEISVKWPSEPDPFKWSEYECYTCGDPHRLRLECEYAVDIVDNTWTVCSTNTIENEMYEGIEYSNYYCSTCYVKSLTFCGYSDWRMPTIDELSALDDRSNCEPVDGMYEKACIIDPFILYDSLVWSELAHEYGSAWNYYSGTRDDYVNPYIGLAKVTLAVRDSGPESDDDTEITPICSDEYSILYDICSLGLYDENDQLIPKDKVISACEEGEEKYRGAAIECIHYYDGDCEAIQGCLNNIRKGWCRPAK